jgi:UDP-N-acetylmuramate--alanine ligase
VYPARETPIDGVSGQIIADAAAKFGHRNVQYVPDKKEIPNLLKSMTKEGDIVMTLGAGDIWKFGNEFLQSLSS